MALTSKLAAIFRITHIDNVDWDLEHGLQCRNSHQENPNFRNIGNLDLIEKRKDRIVPIPPGGTLSDYVPFYFTSRSPMLYNIKTGYNDVPKVPMNDIVIYRGSLRDIAEQGIDIVFTDRHAKLEIANFSNELDDLDSIDWEILSNSDFQHDPADPQKKERYQAEALIHRALPCSLLSEVVCYSDATKAQVSKALARHDLSIPIAVRRGMFF